MSSRSPKDILAGPLCSKNKASTLHLLSSSAIYPSCLVQCIVFGFRFFRSCLILSIFGLNQKYMPHCFQKTIFTSPCSMFTWLVWSMSSFCYCVFSLFLLLRCYCNSSIWPYSRYPAPAIFHIYVLFIWISALLYCTATFMSLQRVPFCQFLPTCFDTHSNICRHSYELHLFYHSPLDSEYCLSYIIFWH